MPEETKTPQTVRELGIEVAGQREVNRIQFENIGEKIAASNDNIKNLTSTVERMMMGKVDQQDFEAHVAWGQAQVMKLDSRTIVLENDKLLRDRSFSMRLRDGIERRAAQIIIVLIFAIALFALVKTMQPIDIGRFIR